MATPQTYTISDLAQEFDAALAVLRKGEFAPAQIAFTNFLKRYPQSGYKAPALFWRNVDPGDHRPFAGSQ